MTIRQVSPFDGPGRFWRGNLHAHSTRSDGHLSPAALREAYRAAGYDFLAITDHFLERYGHPLADRAVGGATGGSADGRRELTTLIAAELHAGRIGTGESWHLLGIGLPADFAPPRDDESGPELARRALAGGAFVAAAHPAWYGATVTEIESLGPIHAIEIWNATVADLNDRADSRYVLDQLLARGGRYFAIATDDAHFTAARDDAHRAWVWVRSVDSRPETLLAALKAGRFYSSTGPEIHELGLDGRNRLSVRCSPVEWIFVTGRGRASIGIRGESLRDAVVDLAELEGPWVQVTLRDAAGGRAWSNPIWLSEEGAGAAEP